MLEILSRPQVKAWKDTYADIQTVLMNEASFVNAFIQMDKCPFQYNYSHKYR